MPLFWVCLSFAAGILLGAALPIPWPTWLLVGAGGAGAAFLLNRLPFPGLAWGWKRLPALGLAPVVLWVAVTLGGARYQLARPALAPDSLAAHNGQGLSSLRGIISAHPDVQDQAITLQVEISEIALIGQPAQATHGRLLVRASPGGDWAYGDDVEITGSPEAPPEAADFSYRDYLSRQGVYTYLPFAGIRRLRQGLGSPLIAWIYELQDRALAQVNRLYPPPESALLAGILLGNDNAIPDAIQQAFKNTGTAHIIAISGFNIAILAGLFATLFTRLLGRWRGAALAAAAIIFYTVLVGAGASVVRAAIMGCVGLLGRQIGRRQDGLNTLAFTSAGMCLFNPTYLWDVSFQLSFMATLGLVLYADPLQQGFLHLLRQRLPANLAPLAGRAAEVVGEFFLFTLAAQITTLPLMAYHFGQVSWIALLANPLVLPPQPLVMVLGGLAVLLSWVWLPLGQLTAALAWPFVAYTIRMVEWWGSIPHGALTLGQVSLALVAGYYLLLFGWTFLRARVADLGRAVRPSLILAGLFALACLVWRAGLSVPDGRLHLLALDTGSDGAFLVTTPGGRSVLINGGASFNQLSDALGRRLPIQDPGLDLLVISARGNADLDALPRALQQFPAHAVLWGGDPGGKLRAVQDVRASLAASGTPVQIAQAGEIIDLGDGARLCVLAVGANGSTFLLEWNKFRALLPLQTGTELPQTGEVQVLLIPKDLPAQSKVDAWMAALNPQLILGEPKPELAGWQTLSTSRNGWIDISTDGEQIWVSAEKQ